jgi:protoporphyrinogen oxidase
MLNFLILGAGPSGLSFAHRLKELGEDSFLILEKEADAGGLCRSRVVDGSAIDIGGGHFLDTKRRHVLNFLFKFMPEENWNHFERKTRIWLKNFEIDYPLESNIFQLPQEEQVEYLHAIALSGEQKGIPFPSSFDDWIYWKFGNKIAEDYMIPYNKKIWSMDLNRLGTNWLNKLPSVNFRETLESCLFRKPHGQVPAHGVFLYPKDGGYGQLWTIMAHRLQGRIRYNQQITKIDTESQTVETVDGGYTSRHIISTIPWPNWIKVASIPDDIEQNIRKLEHTALEIGYHRENLQSDAHWIYIPDESVAHHRILNRRTFVGHSKGYWTETNSKRVTLKREVPEWTHMNDFAYPVNTLEKPDAIRSINAWAASKKIFGLGRWGRWEHMNSDVAVEQSLALADQLVQR